MSEWSMILHCSEPCGMVGQGQGCYCQVCEPCSQLNLPWLSIPSHSVSVPRGGHSHIMELLMLVNQPQNWTLNGVIGKGWFATLNGVTLHISNPKWRNEPKSYPKWRIGQNLTLNAVLTNILYKRCNKTRHWQHHQHHHHRYHRQHLSIIVITAITVIITDIIIITIKGVLDKFNIYLLISNSTENLRLNQSRNFQLILPMYVFSFYEVFCEQHHLQSVP